MNRIFSPLRHSLMASVCVIALSAPLGAQAAKGVDDFEKLSPEQRHERIEKMSDKEREAFHADKKEKWKKMTREEKLTFVEKKHAEHSERFKEKWAKMSDAEKVTFVEEKFNKMRKRHEERWAKMSDDEKIEVVEKRMEKRGKHGKGPHEGGPGKGEHDGPPPHDMPGF